MFRTGASSALAAAWDNQLVLLLAEPKTELVRARWARAAELGLSREADAYPVGTSDADLASRRERLDEVLRGEHRLLEPISGELAGGELVAIVADGEGVILSAQADRRALDPATRVRLVEGARWSEDVRGTNAIGTALVEGRAIAVVGSAHYELRNRELFCFATPIRDVYGDIVAVIDVTGPLRLFDASVGVAVRATGVALERALRSAAWGNGGAGALDAIDRLVRFSSKPAIVVESSGRLAAINAAARAALGLTGAAPSCERVFGVGFDDLVAFAQKPGGMRFETRQGLFRIAIDAIAGTRGRTLAVVVHLEAQPRASLPARQADAFAPVLADDPAVTTAKRKAARFAATSLPVLLLAETGTGKELFARAIHEASDRAQGPFVAINCGALSPELIASELFGYAPGAFTGAQRSGSEGRIHASDGGTLFLDEIGEMPDALQAALLRVLESGSYQRVGEAVDRRADFRLVCATCRDLPAMVARGAFRSDLFYRIQSAALTIPTLRERTDVLWLARQLLAAVTGDAAPELADDAVRFIESHDWPGNVRELKAAMQHGLALSAGEHLIRREHLPDLTLTGQKREVQSASTRNAILEGAINDALRAAGGNVSEAARRLGVSRGTVYRAMKG